ncbi:MAG TPA: hypothetical protein VFR67_27345 [Pilimelia sp.]|nr:hypothetical protein [Pilimelia sp.]
MDRRWARRVGLFAGMAATVVTAVACGPGPVAPLPGQRPTTAAPSTGPPSPAVSPAAAATRPAVRPPPARPPVVRPPAAASPSPSPGLSPACLGAVIYPVDAMSGELPASICLAVGAVLRVQNVEAGTVSAEPAEKASLRYEAGVVDCRLLSVGTVTVTIAGDPSRSIAVVVVE